MEFLESSGLVGWGVVLGVWMMHRINKALVRRYNARLRRALRRDILVDTVRIDSSRSVTRVTINGKDALRIAAEAQGTLKIEVLNGKGGTVLPEVLPPVVN